MSGTPRRCPHPLALSLALLHSPTPSQHPFHFSFVLFVGRAVRLRPQTRLKWSAPRTCPARIAPRLSFPAFINAGFASSVQLRARARARTTASDNRALGQLPSPRVRSRRFTRGYFRVERKISERYRRGYAERTDETKRDRAARLGCVTLFAIVQCGPRARDRPIQKAYNWFTRETRKNARDGVRFLFQYFYPLTADRCEEIRFSMSETLGSTARFSSRRLADNIDLLRNE